MSVLQSIECMASTMSVLLHRCRQKAIQHQIMETVIDCFNCLPVAALIDDRVLCMHGGLSP